ncbi:predicted protein [Micromonas commoda]|uniref:Nucleotide exchange factor Fes1 domain-containing protein n=1 Tax=Micromonas commoda (strain RCC299 / NOUM17 / CCMP2709) TaxID=296587 RepID=C1E4Z7_MICCC|nr:predicted protein [Micromonas commoda]ACO63211.1 predicted protein [Micromonas commoda]|eukprot:XP_002501953.1 predicted protein [Micromonas commoda]
MAKLSVGIASLCVLLLLLPPPTARASGVQPVGQVVDHPVGQTSGGSRSDGDAADALDAVPRETLQSLFNWAIKNSDPEKLADMARRVRDGERVDVGALPDANRASARAVPNQSRWTTEELEQKRRDVREVLDALSNQPTEAQYIKLATGMYTNASLPKEDRILALDELKELVRQIDNANDLHALGALAPLIHVALDSPGTEDEDVASAAASTLAVAMSNNAEVQALVHAWRPPDQTVDRFRRKTLRREDGTYDECDDEAHEHWGVDDVADVGKRDPHHFAADRAGHYGDETVHDPGFRNDVEHRDVAKRRKTARANDDELVARHGDIRVGDWPEPRLGVEARLARLALDESVAVERRVRCMFALGAMLRTSPLSRRSFFAADGAAFIVQALADDVPSRVRVRALVIATDVFENPTVHVTGSNERTLATGERHLAIKGVEAFARLMRRGSRDSREKAVHALKAAMAVDESYPEERMSGHVLREARERGVGEALRAAASFFHANAREDPDVAEYMEEVAREAEDLSAVVAAPEPAAANDEL